LTGKTNQQQAGGDGHGGARGECDWMWEEYRGSSVVVFLDVDRM